MAEKSVFQKRCEDCANLRIKNGIWYCEECFNQKVNDIDDCPMGITLEQLQKMEMKIKENPVKNIAHSATKKERKPKERKPDTEKEQIITDLAKFAENFAENIKITNISKIIEFDIGENHYKIDLIRQRKPK